MKTYRYKTAVRIHFWVNDQDGFVDHRTQDQAFRWIDQNEDSIQNWECKIMEVSKSEFISRPVYRMSGLLIPNLKELS